MDPRRRTSHMVGNRLVEFKLYAPKPICNVGIFEPPHKDLPRVCVIVRDAGRARMGV